MKLAEMSNQINKAFLDALIEKMDKLMKIGGYDVDGDILTFWLEDEDTEYYDGEAHIPFNMLGLRAGKMEEIGKAISIIANIESGVYACMLIKNGGVDLSEVFE